MYQAAAHHATTHLHQEDVHSHAGGVFRVEFHLIVVVEIEFEGKSSQHGLKKRVDGAYIKCGVVIQYLLQGHIGGFAEFFFVGVQVGHQLLHIVAFALREQVQFFHYAMLHLIGCLIGEGNSQDVLVILLAIGEVVAACFFVFLAQKYLDIFISQLVGLSRTCRCLNHLERWCVCVIHHYFITGLGFI